MKLFTRFLLVALALVPCGVRAAPLSGTAGHNLTAYNPNGGAINNNNWNNLTNARAGGGSAPTADFGNCNSVILRCAQPKCANGGCTTMDIATPIVSGCVMSNDTCKKYADQGLIETIAAQLVASATAKNNQAANAAAQAAAQESAIQLQQMQSQMQQMQAEMAAQNQETVAQLQAALEEQKLQTAQAIADANAAQAAPMAAHTTATTDGGTVATSGDGTVMGGLSTAQQIAAQNGVSADILAREQVAGQIMSKIENSQAALKELKAAMQTAFDYAGCDSKGDNCAGPKRVKVFKQKAMAFFDPYEAVLDELYDALIMAQSVGVDITDIYMMLNGSCNAWAKYMCYSGAKDYNRTYYNRDGKKITETIKQWATYDNTNCPNGKSKPSESTRGGHECTDGAVIPPEDSPGCTLTSMITDDEEVTRNFLFADSGDIDEHVRVGCASSALDNSVLFRNRKKQATIDIETLQRIIEQDAPSVFGGNGRMGGQRKPIPGGVKYCSVNEQTLQDLQKVASLKKLPTKVCVPDTALGREWDTNGGIGTMSPATTSAYSSGNCNANDARCKCEKAGGIWTYNNTCSYSLNTKLEIGEITLTDYMSGLT